MNQYKIGQLAKTMGVSSHLLKHYEKFGLVVPKVDKNTNYRYYDISQCSRIIESKKYRNIGFPLNEIAELMNHNSNLEIETKVISQIQTIENQIQELELQRQMAKEYLNESKEIDGKLEQWYIEQSPNFTFLIQSEQHSLYENGSCTMDGKEFIDEIPITKSAILIDKETFHTESMKYYWGIVKQMDGYPKALECEACIVLPASRSFCTYLVVEAPYINNRRLFNLISEKYNKFERFINQNVLAIRYKITHEDKKELHYFKIWISLNM